MPNEAAEKVSTFTHRAVNQTKYQDQSKGQYFWEVNGSLQTYRHQPAISRGEFAAATAAGYF